MSPRARTALHALAIAATAAVAGVVAAAAPITVRVAGAPHFARAQLYDGFGCRGANRSPALEWSAPPAGTRSLAVTMFDPDAPTGHGWWHWIVLDLPPSVRGLPDGAGAERDPRLPPGAVQARNDFGAHAYGGPCPPAGDRPHRYVVTVWALDVSGLPIDRNASGAAIGETLKRHALASGETTLVYGRPRL